MVMNITENPHTNTLSLSSSKASTRDKQILQCFGYRAASARGSRFFEDTRKLMMFMIANYALVMHARAAM